MDNPKPPKKLPKAYYDIWNALYQADRDAPSRQRLAKSLHVSTQTIQRILVNGDVPDFRIVKLPRIRNAWVKSLTRIAHATGNNPQNWITGVHIDWNENIQAISQQELDNLEGYGEGKPGRPENVSLDTSVFQTAMARSPLKIGIADFEPLSTRLKDFQGSFLEEMAFRIFGTIFPGRSLRFVSSDIEDCYAELARKKPDFKIAVGAYENTLKYWNIIHFLPFPWMRMPMGSVVLTGKSRSEDDMKFWDIIRACDPERHLFLVSSRGFAREYLHKGICRMPPEGWIIRSETKPEELAEVLVEQTQKYPNHRVILFSDEIACRIVRKILELDQTVSREYQIRSLNSDLLNIPIGIAFHRDETDLYSAAKSVMEKHLLETGRYLTVKLYDAFLTSSPYSKSVIWKYPALQLSTAAAQNSEVVEAPRRCLSCMEPLDFHHQHSKTDEYCVYCSDEDGRLKPRAEVQTLIASWLIQVQGPMSGREALRRADLYMKAMPAWQ